MKAGPREIHLVLFPALSAFEPSHSWKRARHCQKSGRKNLKSSAASLACVVMGFGSQWGLSTYFHGEKLILPNFSRLRRVAASVSYPEVQIRKETEIGPDEMVIFTFHLENVRTETRTRHISSVISLYTFHGRIVMIIMRRILVLVDESIRTWLSVTLVLNLCQSGQK